IPEAESDLVVLRALVDVHVTSLRENRRLAEWLAASPVCWLKKSRGAKRPAAPNQLIRRSSTRWALQEARSALKRGVSGRRTSPYKAATRKILIPSEACASHLLNSADSKQKLNVRRRLAVQALLDNSSPRRGKL